MQYFAKHLTISLFSLSLFACGGGGGGGFNTGIDNINLSGSVGDGPIINSMIEIRDNSGNILASQLSDASANFSITTTGGDNLYPLTVTATGGTDIVTNATPEFTLYSMSLTKSETRVNINPYSTMIYHVAVKLGGINSSNISTAKQIVTDKLNFGLDTSLVPDPVKTVISESNVAHIVKASEVFAEMIKRTRDMAANAGNNLDANAIINILAADLTDGTLDGNGATGSSQQIAAFANIASAYVAIEAINNRLMVNNANATSALDSAISTTKPGSTVFTNDVAITANLLAQANNIVNAISAINPDQFVTNLKTQLQSISANSYPDSIAYIDTAALNNTLSLLTSASPEVLIAFNNASIGIIANRAPVISGTPATSVTANNVYNFTPSASDIDGDSLTFSIVNKPAWASFNTNTGALTGTPTAAGTFSNITLSVSDGTDSATLTAFSISVSPTPNNAPVITGTPLTSISANNAYSFTPSASDTDGDSLDFSISNKPSWASFNSSTGALTGTPTTAGVSNNVTISVTDGIDSASLTAFNITVSPSPNNAPVIAGTPVTSISVNNAYSFTPSASDADDDNLTFSISNKPAWASFSTSTGALTGTPTTDGIFSNITITVTDGITPASLSAFNITVNPNPNNAPVITGTPTTSINANNAYSFTPSASDADGDNLTFSISNKPAWATFNTATGQLSGTPVNSDINVYNNIIINVSDGTDNSSINFTITVLAQPNQTGNGTATINWTIPETYEDGSALALYELSGYRVYYGNSANNLVMHADINDNSTTTYTVSNLPAGKYYFAITSYDADGIESGLSGIATFTVP